MTTQFVINIVVAFVWMLLQNTLTLQGFIVGFIIGAVILYFMAGRIGSGERGSGKFYLRSILPFIVLSVIFFVEVVKSSLRVAYLVLHPGLPVNPGLITVPLDVTSDEAITMFAGMVTMTPGTLSVDVSEDRSYLYVHALEADDPEEAAAEFKEVFERRIMEVLN